MTYVDRIPEDISDEAARLISDESHDGDHDFTGEQLEAWKAQRLSLLIGLAYIANGQPVPSSAYDRIMSCPCPRSVVPQYITEEREVEHTLYCDDCGTEFHHDATEDDEEVENPEYSHGTDEGAEWVSSARSLIDLNRAYPQQSHDEEVAR